MDINKLRTDRQALLDYVKGGSYWEGKKIISYRLLPVRVWGARRYLVSLKLVLTGDLPKIKVYDCTNLDIALFPDPFLNKNRKVGILSESPGWEHPKVLLENGTGRRIDSSFICSELTTEGGES